MNLWVKICGNTSLADAQLAVDAGADAVGFIFAPSPRQVTPAQVAEITSQLVGNAEKIGVFVDAGFAAIAATVQQCGLTGVQLHSQGDENLPAALRERFGPTLRILQVLHYAETIAGPLQQAAANPAIDAVLVDSRTASAVGGTGIAFDWEAARKTVFSGHSGLKLIAAGGLNPDNIAHAVKLLQPWGVDVSSGTESVPGRKNPRKVYEFVTRARASQAELTPQK